MANKKTVTVVVLSKFIDKHTKELHAKGTTFEAEEKRVAEINKGRSTPLVEVVTPEEKPQAPSEGKPAAEAQGAAEGAQG